MCVAVGEKDRVNLAKNPKLHKLSHVASLSLTHATMHAPAPGLTRGAPAPVKGGGAA